MYCITKVTQYKYHLKHSILFRYWKHEKVYFIRNVYKIFIWVTFTVTRCRISLQINCATCFSPRLNLAQRELGALLLCAFIRKLEVFLYHEVVYKNVFCLFADHLNKNLAHCKSLVSNNIMHFNETLIKIPYFYHENVLLFPLITKNSIRNMWRK